MKKIVQRTCIGCNQKKEKKDLIRIVKFNNNIEIDKTGKKQGRGAYICNDTNCLEKAVRLNRLDRIFDEKIENEIYSNLRGVIIDSRK